MEQKELWLKWAVEQQALAQTGLYYSKDIFDTERYERIREIAAEMLAHQTEIPLEKVKDLFCNETGYQTPKIDTRGGDFPGGGRSCWFRKRTAPGRCRADGAMWIFRVKENTIKEGKGRGRAGRQRGYGDRGTGQRKA